MEALDYLDTMQELYDHIFEPPTEEQLAEWEAEASLFEQEMHAEAEACRQMAEDLKANPMEFLKAALDCEFEVIEVRDVQFAGSKTTMDVVLMVDGEKVHWKIHYQEWAATQWDPGDYDYDIEELEL
jgi:hypothetical protein